MPTPHISAEKGDFAPSILLPGDPLRAKHIAESFLHDAREVNAVRNMLAYTGAYQGIPVSVMGTGMGIPSASIYVTELITQYDVERLIRVGSCGGVLPTVKIRDVILAIGACSDSGVNRVRYGGYDYAATADFALLVAAADAAKAKGVPVKVGNVHSADLFYTPDPHAFDRMEAMGVLAVEMEAAGLYGAAAEKGARALAILTVSDHVRTGEATTSEERQQTFDEMVEIALETIRIDLAG
ncbi:MAG: purine-nucleoside phosphorylase [Actinobacteria bacterium]|nr:purine-nucleoside phosphorylase [Actinomycetota bacterium]MCI0544081.1 purine-nucleoside phosphorylase [Actinomycetota bacterium]MCI0679408.1 purine-nucleoside phosphorylase [Actinomycetota bacterium]